MQDARYYFKEAVKIVKKFGFTGSDLDLCLYMMNSMKDEVFVALYVDDNLMMVERCNHSIN